MMVNYAVLAIIAYYAYRRFRQNHMTTAMLVTLALLVSTYQSALFSILDGTKQTIYRWIYLKQGLKNFQIPCRTEDTVYSEEEHQPLTEGFSLRGIQFNHSSDQTLFENLNLDIPKNKITLVMGPIGSGKSTMLMLLMKYKLPSTGMIYMDGIPYTTLTTEQIRQNIGFVPQQPLLFNRSIYDNITYSIPDGQKPSKAEVEALLTSMGLESFLDQFSEGLDTPCGHNGTNMSGGQRQMVTLLRVMLQKPDYIILDEPTSAVDSLTKKQVIALLKKVMQNKTVIMVTHDQELTEHANMVITFNAGKLISIEEKRKTQHVPW